MRSVSRAARLRDIENMLFRNARGLRVQEIADACEVNRRTIYRDIELLEETGVPIWQDGSRFGIIRDQYIATIRLRFNEAVALYIAARLLGRHADEHNPHIVAALTKIATAFPDPLTEQIGQTAEIIRRQPVNPSFVNVLETLSLCWADQHKAKIWYRSPRSGTVRERVLSPYTLEPSTSGGLYVIGYDEWAAETRTFKLERLEKAERLDETYTIPETFDLYEHFADAWGIMSGGVPLDVTMRFTPRVAALIQERVWHPSQRLVQLEDESLELTVTISRPEEMRPWIRSWGPEVEVLSPPDLRADIAKEASYLAALYH